MPKIEIWMFNWIFPERKSDMTKQIRFMATNTNQSVAYENDIQLNCFAQYYSEKVGTIESN